MSSKDDNRYNSSIHVIKNRSNVPGNIEDTDGLMEYETWCGINGHELSFNFYYNDLVGNGKPCDVCIIMIDKHPLDVKEMFQRGAEWNKKYGLTQK